MHSHSLLTLPLGAQSAESADGFLAAQPLIPYNAEERWLSAYVEREIDCLIEGRRQGLVLLKLYPRQDDHGNNIGDGDSATVTWHGRPANAARPEIAARIAVEALNFFGPLHGGIAVQELHDDVILQGRRYTCSYPHITIERLDAYDAATSYPILSEWRSRRIQNLRRETQTNRMIDMTLLALEIGKSFLPQFLA